MSAGPVTEAEIQRMSLEMPDTVQLFLFLCGLDALPLEGVKKFSADLITVFWPNDPVQANATSILATWARQRIAELEARAAAQQALTGRPAFRRVRPRRAKRPPTTWRQTPPFWSA